MRESRQGVAPLLALCARPSLPEALLPGVRCAAGAIADWQATFDLAEQHGIGPLLSRHLRTAAAPPPSRRASVDREHQCRHARIG